MRAITRRAIGAVAGVGSITAAITLGGIGTASAYAPAHGGGSKCGNVGIEYSLGGDNWTQDGRINGDTPPTTITVKLTDTPGKRCHYNVSLASYSAEGPAWENSGHQDFLGWDTVTLSKTKTQATLDVSKYAPTCFGQVDLYGNGIEYDGGSGKGHGPLPYQPGNVYTPTNLITAWNGGHKCDDQTPTPTPSDTTDTPTPTPSDTTDTPTPTPSDTTDTPTPTPSDSTTSTPTPSVSDTASPSPSATGPTSTAAPTGTPSVPPATSGSGGGNLAETGGNSSQNVAFAGGGAALLVLGGAAVYFTRRRRSGAHS